MRTIFMTFDASRYCTFINCLCIRSMTNIGWIILFSSARHEHYKCHSIEFLGVVEFRDQKLHNHTKQPVPCQYQMRHHNNWESYISCCIVINYINYRYVFKLLNYFIFIGKLPLIVIINMFTPPPPPTVGWNHIWHISGTLRFPPKYWRCWPTNVIY